MPMHPPLSCAALNTDEPYTGVHIRFDGWLLGPASEGFAADYDGQVQIKQVLSLDTEIPDICL